MPSDELPAHERPRERLLADGPDHLSERELLAVLIGAGGADAALATATRLLSAHGSLRALAPLPPAALVAVSGVGPVRAARLAAAFDLARRLRHPPAKPLPALGDERAAGALAVRHFGDEVREVFGALFLDSRNRLLAVEKLFFGTLTAAPVYPREILAAALKLQAAAVILVHNHPSGYLEPSDADRAVTREVARALALIDVPVHDHLVVGDGGYVSMRARGLI